MIFILRNVSSLGWMAVAVADAVAMYVVEAVGWAFFLWRGAVAVAVAFKVAEAVAVMVAVSVAVAR